MLNFDIRKGYPKIINHRGDSNIITNQGNNKNYGYRSIPVMVASSNKTKGYWLSSNPGTIVSSPHGAIVT